MGQLIFSLAALKPLIEHSAATPRQQVLYAHLADKRFWKPGAKPNLVGVVRPTDIDQSKLEPSLVLAKDRGAYLMSGGSPRQRQDDENPCSDVVYARGCDPASDPDWYDTATRECGGDDFAEWIPVSAFHDASGTMTEAVITMGADDFALDLR